VTRSELRTRLLAIKDYAGDIEAAHSMEDSLRADVLREIATGLHSAELAAEFAKLALRTDEFITERWYA
jgi:hypothetical protein